MRSYIRKFVMVAALATPLAALAAETKPVGSSALCSMPCRDKKMTPSGMNALGGQNGWLNSFDSP